MTPQITGKKEFAFTGWHMLASMISFFAVIIAVNFTMAFLATGSWTGLVVKNSYVASQQFNKELQQAETQRQSGLSSDLSYANGELNFILKDRNDQSVHAENLVVVIGRPAFEQADQALSFDRVSATSNSLKLDLAPGVWAVQITGNFGQMPYRRDARLFVGSDGVGRLE